MHLKCTLKTEKPLLFSEAFGWLFPAMFWIQSKKTKQHSPTRPTNANYNKSLQFLKEFYVNLNDFIFLGYKIGWKSNKASGSGLSKMCTLGPHSSPGAPTKMPGRRVGAAKGGGALVVTSVWPLVLTLRVRQTNGGNRREGGWPAFESTREFRWPQVRL